MQIVRKSTIAFLVILAVILGAGTGIVTVQAGLGPWLGLLPAALVLLVGLRKSLRRWRTAKQSFPDRWRHWLSRHVPYYRRLHDEHRHRFERDILFFLDEHAFESLDGVEETDILRLSVAAGAALLLHGRPDWELPATRTILFYPDRFDDEYYDSADADYDGMVHAQGPVILSARAVEESWDNPGDGSNVVLHELAHLFDFDHTDAGGAPSLMDASSATAWAALVDREMRKARHGMSMLRPYAATDAAELFAVAVENFFERPDEMRRRHGELFRALRSFFNLDPSKRMLTIPGEAGEPEGGSVT